MKTLLLIGILLTTSANAAEVVTGFDSEKDLPVLNNELRTLDVQASQLSDRVEVLEAVATPGAATQAQQEAATSTTTYVSPGTQKYGPSAAKAFCSFNGSGTPAMLGTPYNFSSTITDNAQGDWTLTFSSNLSGTNYCVVATTNDVTGSGVAVNVTSKSASQIRLKARQTDTQGAVDPTWVDVVVFGDL